MSEKPKRILTGIQSTGIPHLGNILGAIIPAINFSKKDNVETYLFIADFHSLTQIKDSKALEQNTLFTASAWLACGLNPSHTIFYRQSDVPQVTELAWYLSCFFPYNRLTLAHSFKDKKDRLKDVNSGLFNYPMLMAADILLYDAEIVPVGKDQLQHLEITRDIAEKFNRKYGDFFNIPEAVIKDEKTVLGTDGRKMSKSYNNIIPLLAEEKELKKSIMKIVTNSQEPGEKKDWRDNTLFSIYSSFTSKDQQEEMQNMFGDGIGWGDAKQKTFEELNKILTPIREKYLELNSNKKYIEEILKSGAEKVREQTLPLVKEAKRLVGISKL